MTIQADTTKMREPEDFMHTRFPAAAAVLFASLALAMVPELARADDMSACVQAYDASQRLRRSMHLLDAQHELRVCARQECPSIVRDDCVQWLSEVEKSLPSIVVAVKTTGGRDLTDVRVTLDGALWLEHLDGKAVDVDPGKHVLRAEWQNLPPVETTVLVREAEKGRIVSLVLSEEKRPVDGAPPALAPRTHRPIPMTVYVFGGLGAIATGSFAYFGLTGRSEVLSLERDCRPYCTQTEVDATQRKLVAADVSLGVALLSLGAATYFYVARPQRPVATAAVPPIDLSPLPGGALAQWAGAF